MRRRERERVEGETRNENEPRSPTGRMLGRLEEKMRNIWTVQMPVLLIDREEGGESEKGGSAPSSRWFVLAGT